MSGVGFKIVHLVEEGEIVDTIKEMKLAIAIGQLQKLPKKKKPLTSDRSVRILLYHII